MAKKNVAKRVEQRRARKQLKRQYRLSKRNRAGTPVWRRPQPKALRPKLVKSLVTTAKVSARVKHWNMQLAAMLALCVTCVLAFSIPACGGVRSRPLSFREQSVEITSVPKDAVFYLDDIQGSPVAEVDATGEVLSRTDYHPYGHVRYQSGKAGDPWGYVGNEEDRGSGTSDFHARPYRPEAGIFASVDPEALFHPEKFLTKPRKLFPYAYAGSDPTNEVDRDGREPVRNQAGTVDDFMSDLRRNFGDTLTRQQESLHHFSDTVVKLPKGFDFWNVKVLPGKQVRWANDSTSRYIFTSKAGWLDMSHVLFYASMAQNRIESGQSHYGAFRAALDHGELQERLDGPVSAYSYEDLPSDYHGAYFASYVFNSKLRTTFAAQLSDYLRSLGAKRPQEAPNFRVLPENDDESYRHGGPQVRNHTFEKVKLQ